MVYSKIEIAEKQLDRVLGFFARIESKAPTILGLNVGMLAVLAINLPVPLKTDVHTVMIFVSFGCIAVSLYHLYRCTFPITEGGSSSIFYFQEIARRAPGEFADAYVKADEQSLTNDLLGQIHRNSQILDEKFTRLRKSLVWMGVGIASWLICLATLALSLNKVKFGG